MDQNSVSVQDACHAVCSERCPVEGVDPGKLGAVTVPAFLLPLVQQLVQQYGPTIVPAIEQAAVMAIETLAAKFNITRKSS